MVPFNGFRSDEYFYEKLNKSKLYKYEPLFSENTEFENLAVTGTNKLDLEAEVLNKYDNY